MLTNPTIETLKSLKLHGMVEALEEQQQTPAIQALSFEERIALIVDRERLHRDNQRRSRLLRGAHLKVAEASIEDINYKAARGLDKRQIAQLASGEWIRRSQNLLITGATVARLPGRAHVGGCDPGSRRPSQPSHRVEDPRGIHAQAALTGGRMRGRSILSASDACGVRRPCASRSMDSSPRSENPGSQAVTHAIP